MRIVEVRHLRPTAAAALAGVAGGVLVGFPLVGIGGWASALLGSTLLGLLLASYIYLTLALAELGRRLLVSRVVVGAPVEGYAVPVRVRVESRSPLVAGFVEIADTPPGDVPLLSPPAARGLLAPGSSVVLTYFVAPRIGSRRFGRLVLGIRDLLGFYRAIVEVEPEGDLVLYGIPSRAVVERELRLLEREDPYALPRARLVRKEGTEIYGIREFVEGDEPRLIDWKATARLGKLFVKELRRETYVPVLFVLAPGPGALEGEPFKTPFERMARLIAALSQEVILRDGTAGLLVLSGGRVLAEPPLKAGEGLGRLIRLLGSAPLPDREPQGLLNRVLDYLRKHSPGRIIIVVATDKPLLPRAWREMNPLAERKYTILYLTAGPGEAPRLVPHKSVGAALEG